MNFNNFYWALIDFSVVSVSGRESGDPSSCGPWFLVRDAKKNLRAYLLQESLWKIKKKRDNTSKRVVGQGEEENSPGSQGAEFLRQGFLHNPGVTD